MLAGLIAAPALAAPPAAWVNNCQVCHQADGAGLPGQFPRLKGRAAAMAATPQGRTYLAGTVVHGAAGRIVVDGKPIVGVMPGFATLPDAGIAAALNHAIAGGNAAPFKPAEIAAARKTTPADVKAARAALVAAGVIE